LGCRGVGSKERAHNGAGVEDVSSDGALGAVGFGYRRQGMVHCGKGILVDILGDWALSHLTVYQRESSHTESLIDDNRRQSGGSQR